MINRIKSTFLLGKTNLWQMPLLLLGCGLLGSIIATAVLLFLPSEKNFVNMGTVFVILGAIFCEIILICSQFWMDFEMAVKMGITRKSLIISQTLLSIVHLIIAICVVFLYLSAENFFANLAFGDRAVNLLENFNYKIALQISSIVLLFILGFGMFFGSMAQRYGKTAIVVIYGLFLSSLFLTTFVERFAKNDGLIGKIFTNILYFVQNINAQGLAITVIALALILIVISVLLLLRARIKA